MRRHTALLGDHVAVHFATEKLGLLRVVFFPVVRGQKRKEVLGVTW